RPHQGRRADRAALSAALYGEDIARVLEPEGAAHRGDPRRGRAGGGGALISPVHPRESGGSVVQSKGIRAWPWMPPFAGMNGESEVHAEMVPRQKRTDPRSSPRKRGSSSSSMQRVPFRWLARM